MTKGRWWSVSNRAKAHTLACHSDVVVVGRTLGAGRGRKKFANSKVDVQVVTVSEFSR